MKEKRVYDPETGSIFSVTTIGKRVTKFEKKTTQSKARTPYFPEAKLTTELEVR